MVPVSMPERVPGQLPAFPGAVVHAGLIYTSGCVDLDALRGEVRSSDEQARAALRALLEIVEHAGGGNATVLRVEAYLSSRRELEAWGSAFREQWPGTAPARTTLITELALPSLTIEIQAIAAIQGTDAL